MNRNMTYAVAILAATSFAGGALASNGYATGHHGLPERGDAMHVDGTMMGHFDHIDRNDDGKVSREEMAAHGGTDGTPGQTVGVGMGPNR